MGKIFKGGEAVKKGKLHGTGWAIALLAYDYLCDSLFRVVFGFIIHFVPVDENDQVGILFDGARFS